MMNKFNALNFIEDDQRLPSEVDDSDFGLQTAHFQMGDGPSEATFYAQSDLHKQSTKAERNKKKDREEYIVVENSTSEFKNRSNSQATRSGQTTNKLTKDKNIRTAGSVPKSTHTNVKENG